MDTDRSGAGLAYACVTPHGGEILPELAHDPRVLERTRAAMAEIASRCREAAPDLLVVASPHTLRLEGAHAVLTCEWASGTLGEGGPAGGGSGRSVSLEVRLDPAFARAWVRRACDAGLPVVGCNFGALEGPASRLPLDWGALVPLRFMARAWHAGAGPAEEPSLPPVVIAGPTRDVPWEQLVRLGRTLVATAREAGRRVAFVASADQAHAHDPSGPYGFDPAAARYDELVTEIVREDRLEDLLRIDPDLVARAKPDSLWQMLMLHGALLEAAAPADEGAGAEPGDGSGAAPGGRGAWRGELMSYERPTYFGMLCASYARSG